MLAHSSFEECKPEEPKKAHGQLTATKAGSSNPEGVLEEGNANIDFLSLDSGRFFVNRSQHEAEIGVKYLCL